MEFGIQLVGNTPQDILDMAALAEKVGIKNAFVPDHFAMESPGGAGLSPDQPVWEAIAILGAMAERTSTLEVGALVLCNLFRHPALTAQAVATIDRISGGRAILGLGSGWTKAEFDMTGVGFPDIKPRLRQLDESLRIIRSLWIEDRTNFEGEFYQLRDAFIPARPERQPCPPILLGGGGKGLLRIAARHADLVNIVVETGKAGTILLSEVAKLAEDAFRKKVDFVREEANGHDREIRISTTGFMTILTDTEEQGDQMAAAVASGFGLDPAAARRMPISLVGTPSQWIAELQRREKEWGLDHMVLSGGLDAATLERVGKEVLPYV